MATQSKVVHTKAILESASFDEPMANIEFLDLDESWKAEVIALEPRCYPAPWSAGVISSEFESEVSHRFGAVSNGRLIGYIFCYIVEDELHVLNLAVDPGCRHRGLGKAILAHAMEQSLAFGVRRSFLEVRVSNQPAQLLYRKLGFSPVGMRRGYYKDNGEDAITLERVIGPEDRGFLKQIRDLVIFTTKPPG